MNYEIRRLNSKFIKTYTETINLNVTFSFILSPIENVDILVGSKIAVQF